MAYIDITPTMTSNTLPSPCVASDSGNWENGFPVYQIFDKVSSLNSSWVSANNQPKDCWVMLDFGVRTIVDAIEIASRPGGYGGVQEFPKNFNVYGSDNGTEFTLIHGVTNASVSTTGQKNKYVFPKRVKYRYYKLYILENNGYATYTALTELSFLKDDSITTDPDDKILTFHKKLESNVLSTVAPGVEKVIFTNEGNIYTYKKTGEKFKLGGVEFCTEDEITTMINTVKGGTV